MSEGFIGDSIHPDLTNRRKLKYQFTAKHHKPGQSEDAQWLSTLSRDDEFQVFNKADEKDVSNDKGDLFGMHLDKNGNVLILGTCDEQIAKFPLARLNETWHGFPYWPRTKPIMDTTERNYQPPKEALKKMKDAGWITGSELKRLVKGKHA